MTAFLPLAQAGPDCGGKANALGRLARAGFAVPAGAVLPARTGAGAASWESQLPSVLRGLGGESFAVRSSALGEDGPTASFAGQFHTSLSVAGPDVAREIHRTIVSHDQVATYSAAVGATQHRGVAVIVQRMLIPDVAGVAFTRHPVTGEREVVIEAVRGLGEPLVSGDVSPQPGVLSSDQTREVIQTAEQVEALLGGGQDIEWAIAEGRLWVLQARPITTAGASTAPDSRFGGRDTHLLASGTPAAPGTAIGILRIVGGPDDFVRFGRGDVLVCRSTSPAWMPVLARASAVVTECGGVLSHAAIIARELRIPAITDVREASGLPDGVRAAIDGAAGTGHGTSIATARGVS